MTIYRACTNEELLNIWDPEEYCYQLQKELIDRFQALLDGENATLVELKADVDNYERKCLDLEREAQSAHESWENDLIKAQSELSTAEEKLRQIKLLVGDC